jgi:hypothetical protein
MAVPPNLQNAMQRRVSGGAKKKSSSKASSKSAAHPGFAAVQNKIANQQGVSQKAAGAILANSSRNASPAAKKANPRLKRV